MNCFNSTCISLFFTCINVWGVFQLCSCQKQRQIDFLRFYYFIFLPGLPESGHSLKLPRSTAENKDTLFSTVQISNVPGSMSLVAIMEIRCLLSNTFLIFFQVTFSLSTIFSRSGVSSVFQASSIYCFKEWSTNSDTLWKTSTMSIFVTFFQLRLHFIQSQLHFESQKILG